MTATPEAPIRRATTHDAAVVGRLLADFNEEFDTAGPSAADFAARFEHLLGREDVLVHLAEGPDDAVGFAFVTLRPTPYGDGPLAQLEELYVVPKRRDQGIGTRLLTVAIDAARAERAIEMHINVDEIDVAARRFYERHGFVNMEPDTTYRMLCYLRAL